MLGTPLSTRGERWAVELRSGERRATGDNCSPATKTPMMHSHFTHADADLPRAEHSRTYILDVKNERVRKPCDRHSRWLHVVATRSCRQGECPHRRHDGRHQGGTR